jgi:hypothetical protein
MFKGKLVFLSLIAALLCWQVMPASVDTANSGIVDPCSSTATGAGCCYLVCPQGDGTRFDDPVFCGAIIHIRARDGVGLPIPGIPPQDIWLIGCNDQLCLCGGSGSINADSVTNWDGRTTISGDMAAGGCDIDGLAVVVQSTVIDDPGTLCTTILCLPYPTVSPDINCDLIVDIIDFSLFAAAYGPPPTYDECLDYNCDGFLDIVDFSLFAQHYLHAC